MRLFNGWGVLAVAGFGCVDTMGTPHDALWSAEGAVAAVDGLYVPMPRAHDVVRLAPGEEPVYLELSPWRPERLEAPATGDRVLIWVSAQRCDDPAAEEPAARRADCEGELRTSSELRVWSEGVEQDRIDLPLAFGPMTFSDDGRWSVAIPDAEAAVQAQAGVVSLDTLLILDLEEGRRFQVPVGFDTSSVRFLPDGAGGVRGLVVLSASRVAILDLTRESPRVETSFPLTLSLDQEVEPLSVALSADGSFAMVTVAGQSDLYTLDLVNPSINLVALSGVPSDVVVDVESDRSLFAYGSDRVDVLDHATLEVTTHQLESLVSRFLVVGDRVLGLPPRGGSRRFVYRIDLSDPDRVPFDVYRLNQAPIDGWMSPDGAYALLSSGSSVAPRLQVLDLEEREGRLDVRARELAVERQVREVLWTDPEDGLVGRLLLEGLDRLYSLDPAALIAEESRLVMAPGWVGRMVDGATWIAHDDPLGRVSFLDAAGGVQTVEGFAWPGWMAPPVGLLTEEAP